MNTVTPHSPHEEDDIWEYARRASSDGAVSHRNHETLGALAGLAAGAATGAALPPPSSGMLKDVGAVGRAKLGAGAVGVANLIGMIAAAITRRRTLKEQMEHDEKSVLWDYIPGVAAYNQTKRIGVDLAFWREVGKRVKENRLAKGGSGRP